MSIESLVDIPEDLAAEAAEVEGLPDRLLMFIRQEVALDKRRRSRHSDQARQIVKRAYELAEEKPMTDKEKQRIRQTFMERYEKLLSK